MEGYGHALISGSILVLYMEGLGKISLRIVVFQGKI
jgi:hypothetical protein